MTFTFYRSPARKAGGLEAKISNRIRVIEQSARACDRAALNLTLRIAGIYIAAGKLVWVPGCEGRIARKTAKWDRLERDSKLAAGRPGAQRGLSARVGEYLAGSWRRREPWAVTMLGQIMQRRLG